MENLTGMEVLNDVDFEQIFALLKSSFPPEERRTYAEQRALLSKPLYRIYGKKDTGSDAIVAMAAVWELEDLVFIEHLAVNPNYRNGGVGAEFLEELVQQFSNMICLEVEPPMTELARRRIGFYERNGFCYNAYPYMQPSISKGRSPIALKLMTYGHTISTEEFEQMRDVLYRIVYGVNDI